MATTNGTDKLSKAERELVAEGLELLMKSHDRAARAQKGAIAEAHDAASKAVYVLLNKVRTAPLEL